MKRLFVAVPVSEEVKEKIRPLFQLLKATGADLNTVAPENLHFTLKFLGDVEESRIQEIVERLSARLGKKFTLRVQGLGTFPSLERINVVWAGVGSGDQALLTLTKEVNQLLNYIRKDEREEIPHLTIARVKSGKNKDKVREIVERNKAMVFGTMDVDKFLLYENELGTGGPVYRTIKEFILD